MRKTVLATALAAAAALPGLASAQGTSPHSVAGNMSIVSDYRFRGISQTFVQPAIQGGIDYSHSSGFYVGNWNSNVSGISFVDGSIEMDIYGGYKFGAGPVTVDVGLLQYLYPGAENAGVKYDTLEAYVGVGWKWFTLKYSTTLDDYFGVADSDGSGYLDLSASYEIAPKLTLVGHVGQQEVKNAGALDYVDYKIGLTYDLDGWLLGVTYIDTDVNDATYTVMNGALDSEDLAKGTVVFSVSKSF
jgi:uncharacterized protein (TIGR02001 family)